MKADVEKLKRARDLVARPGGWTQGVTARAAEGVYVDEMSSKAVCYCMLGACYAVGGRADTIDLLRPAVPGGRPAKWQDKPERTQVEVVNAFDRAIALAEA